VLSVDPQQSYLWHVLQLYCGGCALITDAVNTLATGQALVTQPQAAGGAYYSFPTAADLARFDDKGLTLVDEPAMIDFIKANYY
jgi:methionyl-tRNA formyltransferase